MNNFKGFLIRFPKTETQFPQELIQLDTYESTPLQRSEISAYRDINNLLHRVTSPNAKTKLTFQTINLSIEQMQNIRNIINSAFLDSQQRKLRVEYWDDELLNYRIMTAYIPDLTYKVRSISGNNIKYEPVTFTFIEY